MLDIPRPQMTDQSGPVGSPIYLTLIGYWSGPQTSGEWPDVTHFVDRDWDVDERSTVARYLESGTLVMGFGGVSACRICGRDNGGVEFSDGVFVWPEGLAHYVEEHAVRLPAAFVQHVTERLDALDVAYSTRNTSWWAAHTGSEPT